VEPESAASSQSHAIVARVVQLMTRHPVADP
jgi:hypothetical protein